MNIHMVVIKKTTGQKLIPISSKFLSFNCTHNNVKSFWEHEENQRKIS